MQLYNTSVPDCLCSFSKIYLVYQSGVVSMISYFSKHRCFGIVSFCFLVRVPLRATIGTSEKKTLRVSSFLHAVLNSSQLNCETNNRYLKYNQQTVNIVRLIRLKIMSMASFKFNNNIIQKVDNNEKYIQIIKYVIKLLYVK